MRVFYTEALFLLSLSLYALAAVAALALMGRRKACSTASNILCMAAAAAGAASALLHLTGGAAAIRIPVLRSPLPLIAIELRIDGLSSFFLLGLSLVVFCVSLYSTGYLPSHYGERNLGAFNFLYAAFILSMVFVLTGGSAVAFFIAWEMMSALSYFLVVFESEREETRRAGTLYLVMTGLGTAFLMIGFMLMYAYTGAFDPAAGARGVPAAVRNIQFLCFLLGFGTKAGVIPLHLWLPAAHPAAPSNVSALMSGVMIKTAIYGLLRYAFQYLGAPNPWWGAVLLIIGAVSAVLGVAYALMEQDVKRLLAFSSIENIGVIWMGLGAAMLSSAQGNAAAGALALAAALFHTFNHTVFKSGLFLGAGAMQHAAHTRDIEQLGGLVKRMPQTALLMLCFSLAISAMVPLNGFVSEWLTFQSLFAGIGEGRSGYGMLSILAVAALALCGALAAACFARLFGIAFLGRPRSAQAGEALEVPRTMRAGMWVLAAVCLAAGLLPMAFLRVVATVAEGLGGMGLMETLRGGAFFAWVPVQTAGAGISPAALLILLAALAALALLVVRLVGGKTMRRRYGTWDCGYKALNARMQYTATGFSKPVKIVLRVLFRPARELKVKGVPYHPESMEYTVASESLFEKYLYDPVAGFIKGLSGRVRGGVQTGSARRYLAYIFVALVLLMLYNIVA